MTTRVAGTGERQAGVSADWPPRAHLCALPWSSRSGNSCSSTLSQRSRQLHSQSGLTTCSCPHSWAWRTFSVPAGKLIHSEPGGGGAGVEPEGRGLSWDAPDLPVLPLSPQPEPPAQDFRTRGHLDPPTRWREG